MTTASRYRFMRSIAVIAASAVACTALSRQAMAANGSWNVDGNAAWSGSTNWQGNIIPGATTSTTSTDIATFGLTLTVSRTVTVDNNRNIGGITFSSTSTSNYLLTNGSLRLSNGGVIQTTAGVTGTSSILTPISIMGDGGSATFTAGGTAATAALKFGAISGVSGTGNVTTLTLNGDNAASTTANSIAQNVLTDGTFGGKLAIVKSGNGTWYFQNSQPFTGGVTLSGGLLTTNNATGFGTGTITFNGGGMGTSDPTGRTYAQNVRFTGDGTIGSSAGGSAVMTFTGPVDLGASMRTLTTIQPTVFSGTVAGNGGITKTGTSSLTLSGSNTFAGGLTLSNGTLLIGNDYALGSGTLAISGGTLNTSGGARTLQTNNAQAWNGSFTFTGSNDLNLGTGPVTLGTTGTVTVSGSTLTIGGGISGAGFGFTKAGAGSLVLNGNNSFTGPVVVSAGTLLINGSNSGNSTVSGATSILQYGNVNALGTGTVSMSIAGATLRAGVSGTVSSNILVGNLASAANTITLDNNGYNQTFAGVISGTGNAGVKVQGSGTTIFAGNNTYAGVLNVAAGSRLLVLGTSSLLSGAGAAATIDGVVEYASDANSEIGGQLNGNGTLIMNGSGALALATSMNPSGTVPIILSKGVVTFGNNVGNLGGLTFNGGAIASNGVLARTGAATVPVTFSGDGTITTPTLTGAITLAGPVDLGAATRTLTVSTTATLSGTVSNGGLTKAGTGTLVLTATNTFSGTTRIDAGTLDLGGNARSLQNSVVDLGGSGTLANYTATPVFGGITNYAGFSLPNTITRLTLNVVAGGTQTYESLPGGGAAAIGLGKTGPGTLVFTGSSTWSGATTIDEGVFQVASLAAAGTPSPLGSGTTVNLGSGTTAGTLRYVGNGHSSNRMINVQGTVGGTVDASGSGALDLTSGTISAAANTVVTLTGSSGAGNTIGMIAGAGASVIKTGEGLWKLSGNNSFTGQTSVTQGTLVAASNTALGVSPPATLVGGTDAGLGGTAALLLAGTTSLNQSLQVLAAGGGATQTVILGGANTSGTTSFGSAIVRVARDVTLQAATGGVVRFGSNWTGASGSGSLTDRSFTFGSAGNTGTVIVSSSIATTGGMTVAAGVLRLADQIVRPGTGQQFLVGSAGELAGTGTVAAVLAGAGSVGPGNSPGILLADGVDPTGGLDFDFEFTDLVPVYSSPTASANDILRLTGTAPFTQDLTGSNSIDIYFPAAVLTTATSPAQTYQGGFFTDRTAAQFAGFQAAISGAAFTYYVPDPSGTISYKGNPYSLLPGTILVTPTTTTVASAGFSGGTVTNGQIMTFIVVPEPGALALAAIGITAAAFAIRRGRYHRAR